jgi:4-amino-4-deoxy-L-arabinose transferase-like glycosyltransferase
MINVVSGGINTDQNDVIFMCYVVLSFWTFIEYTFSEKWIHLIFTGIFVAAAILVKWLPGLLVFSAWFFWLIFSKNKKSHLKYWLHLFYAGLIAILIPATWFISAYFKWPEEFKVTMDLYSKHINDDLAHPGVWFYHFQYYYDNFGWLVVTLFFVGVIISIIQEKYRNIWSSIFISILITFSFYSAVLTRMPLMCLIAMPLMFLFIGLASNEVLNFLNKLPIKIAPVFIFFLLSIFSISLLNYGEIERMHSFRDENIYRQSRMHNQKVLIETSRQLKRSKVDVLLNCGFLGNGVINMYYTDLTAYDKIPDEDEFNTLRKNKIKAAIFDDGNLPEFILRNDSILILPDKIMRTGM